MIQKLLDSPTWVRVSLFVAIAGILAAIVFGIGQPKVDVQFPNAPAPSNAPTEEPTTDPTEVAEPSAPPEVSKEEAAALDEESGSSAPLTYDEESIVQADAKGIKLEGSEDVAIEGVENYFAYSLNEEQDVREKRLSKFFLPGSPYIKSSPNGEDQIPGGGEDLAPDLSGGLDIGGKVGVSQILAVKDGKVTYQMFLNVRTLIDNFASDDSKAWMFSHETVVQVTLKNVDGGWRIVSILEEGDVAR